jgi:uncharacterized protein (TIGR02996 family)
MGIEEGFIRDIIEHTDDDTPRLIYADWLDDHGEPERAEFIRVQCELARLKKVGMAHYCEPKCWTRCKPLRDDQESHCEGLRRREREFLGVTGYWAQWLHQAFDHLAYEVGVSGRYDNHYHVSLYSKGKEEQGDFYCSFRRGFVAEVTLSCAAWVGRACSRCGGNGFYTSMGPDTFTRRCENCDGTGRMDAHGPALLKAAPLEWVDLTDKRPFQSTIIEHSVCWYRIRQGVLGSSGIINNYIPPELFDLLEDGWVAMIDDQPAFRVYHGVDQEGKEKENPALQDLSRACRNLFKK